MEDEAETVSLPDDLVLDLTQAALAIGQYNGGFGVITIQFKGIDSMRRLLAPVLDIQMRQFREKRAHKNID